MVISHPEWWMEIACASKFEAFYWRPWIPASFGSMKPITMAEGWCSDRNAANNIIEIVTRRIELADVTATWGDVIGGATLQIHGIQTWYGMDDEGPLSSRVTWPWHTMAHLGLKIGCPMVWLCLATQKNQICDRQGIQGPEFSAYRKWCDMQQNQMGQNNSMRLRGEATTAGKKVWQKWWSKAKNLWSCS